MNNMADSPEANKPQDDFRPRERLRILAAEYESKVLEAQSLREKMLRLVGVAVLVMGVIASIPGLAAVESVAKSSLFWWCAPAVLAALFAALVMLYGNLNGLVYYRRDLEDEINEALGGSPVLRYENGFSRAFYSIRTGDRSMRVIHLALLLALAGIYIGSVALSLGGLTAAYEKVSKVLQPAHRAMFIGTYAALGLFLAYAFYRAAFHMRPLYDKVMRANVQPRIETVIPWRTLLIARPLEIVTKSLFFWGAFGFGVICGGHARLRDIIAVWICLELFVNQAKYVLNDIYDVVPDSSSCDVRDNPFKGLSPITLRFLAAGAIVKACIGSLLAYWWLGKDLPTAIGVFLLLPMQIVYNRARSGSSASLVNSSAKTWLNHFRAKEDPRLGILFLLSEDHRAQAVKNVGLLGADHIPNAEGGRGWCIRTLFLALLLGVGYAIRLGIPLHLVGLSRDHLLLFAGYLAWGTVLGFAFILGYWSWEGAWYAQRPSSFDADRRSNAEGSYVLDAVRSKAHTLWCYRKLEKQVGKRGRLWRPWAPWEMAWFAVLLTGPLLGAWTIGNSLNGIGSWLWTIAGGVFLAALYILPRVPGELNRLEPCFLGLLLLYIAIAFFGYRPTCLFVFLPSVFAVYFAAHYTAGPWRNFDQRYVAEGMHLRLAEGRRQLLRLLDSLLMPSGQ
jgi:hypothetical protein